MATSEPEPPGWYPNPDGSDDLRYWDGHGWTPHRREKAIAIQHEPPVDTSPEPVEHLIRDLPPDWYPDPDGSGGKRFWDGQGWTTQRRAVSTVAHVAEQAKAEAAEAEALTAEAHARAHAIHADPPRRPPDEIVTHPSHLPPLYPQGPPVYPPPFAPRPKAAFGTSPRRLPGKIWMWLVGITVVIVAIVVVATKPWVDQPSYQAGYHAGADGGSTYVHKMIDEGDQTPLGLCLSMYELTYTGPVDNLKSPYDNHDFMQGCYDGIDHAYGSHVPGLPGGH
jgi:hypothetical protein